MEVVNIHKAKADFLALLERVLKGEKIVIAKEGKPVASLEKIKKLQKRKGGQFKGKIWVADDFDVLPADFLKHFQ
jgi:prevent-host-death family protein